MDFSKSFHTVSLEILIHKLLIYGLNKETENGMKTGWIVISRGW